MNLAAVILLASALAPSTCPLGNLLHPSASVGNWITGGEAFAACCNEPLANETSSWGGLKSLFR